MGNKALSYGMLAGIAVLVVVIIVLLINKLKPAEDVTRSIKLDASKLTYDNTQYVLYASQLHTAMSGAGTDTDTIMRVLGALKTSEDWSALLKAFGTRSVSKWWGYSFSGTLIDWLTDELSAKELQAVNEVLAKIGVSI